MKRIIYLICIGTLALVYTAQGEEGKEMKSPKVARKASSVHTTVPGTSAPVNAQRNAVNTHFHPRTSTVTSRTTSKTVAHRSQLQSNHVQVRRAQSVSSARSAHQIRTRNNVAVNRERNIAVTRSHDVKTNREKSVAVTNNWRSGRFTGQQYAAFRNYHRQWHDSDWWRNHYSRIIFVGGGWWAWNAGYWYPAWGYDRGYYYPYDGPIYGYNDLTPDQVVVNVQAQLQRDGYYAGPVDGVLGPMTRQAISAFQADHGLAVTSAVDEPTLATLGLV